MSSKSPAEELICSACPSPGWRPENSPACPPELAAGHAHMSSWGHFIIFIAREHLIKERCWWQQGGDRRLSAHICEHPGSPMQAFARELGEGRVLPVVP